MFNARDYYVFIEELGDAAQIDKALDRRRPILENLALADLVKANIRDATAIAETRLSETLSRLLATPA